LEGRLLLFCLYKESAVWQVLGNPPTIKKKILAKAERTLTKP
jgi:hypothetical protein